MIIAEACCNWHDLDEAKQMIQEAKNCGAGLVKFQLYDADDDRGKPHYVWVKAHELTFDQAKELFDYGASIGQEVFFSVFGARYVEWCEKIGVKRYKLASSVNKDIALHLAVDKTQKEVYESLPYGRGYDLHQTRFVAWRYLYCVPCYPAPLMSIFRGINFENQFKGSYPFAGFSDHTIGLDAAKIALARGAQIVEKHFCLEHDSQFPDNAWSMTPEELRELVRWDKVCQEVIG